MIKVKDIMTTDVLSVSPETEIVQAAKLLLENRINGLPVVDDSGKLVGIICQSDLIAQQKRFPLPSLFTVLDGFIPFGSLKQLEKEVSKIAAVTVAEAMTTSPVTVTPDSGIEEAVSLIIDNHFHTVPVVENNRMVGVIGKIDVLKTII